MRENFRSGHTTTTVRFGRGKWYHCRREKSLLDRVDKKRLHTMGKKTDGAVWMEGGELLAGPGG